MSQKTATFVQLNICGVSEHSKTALDNFIHESVFFSFVSMEQKNLRSDFFNNFHTEASKTGNSVGVALSVNQGLLFARINEPEYLDSVWILCVLDKLKLLIATAYIRPNTIVCLKSFLQQLEAAQQFIKTS